MNEISREPLCWPVGWKRLNCRFSAQFQRHSIAESKNEIIRQVNLLQGKQLIISSNLRLKKDGFPYSNQRMPEDQGIAVYFNLKDKPIVFACDKWNVISHNLWAIAKHIDALRGQERWGVGSIDQAFSGYKQLGYNNIQMGKVLPALWCEVLGFDNENKTIEEIKKRYRQLIKQHHPDHGGAQEEFIRITKAYKEGIRIIS